MEEPFAANMKAGASLAYAPMKAYDQLRSMVWKKSGITSYQRLFRPVSSRKQNLIIIARTHHIYDTYINSRSLRMYKLEFIDM